MMEVLRKSTQEEGENQGVKGRERISGNRVSAIDLTRNIDRDEK
jgi:hypothetical protein